MENGSPKKFGARLQRQWHNDPLSQEKKIAYKRAEVIKMKYINKRNNHGRNSQTILSATIGVDARLTDENVLKAHLGWFPLTVKRAMI